MKNFFEKNGVFDVGMYKIKRRVGLSFVLFEEA